LGRIGADATAKIVSDAIRIVTPIPLAKKMRDARIDGLGEEALGELSSLDADFLAKPDDLTELLFAFVAGHPQEFGEIQPQ
jgi:hypothetical protein